MNHLNLEEFERKIAYTFSDKNLLILALTHSSYANETKKGSHENNERLEFLGDAVLDMVVSEYMYRHFPKMPEGELTKLRAAVVCEGSLAELSRKLGVGRCLLLGKGEESTGGRSRDSILADAFEAIIGAICMDGGMEAVTKYIMGFMEERIESTKSNFRNLDCKTHLQEVIQKTSNMPLWMSMAPITIRFLWQRSRMTAQCWARAVARARRKRSRMRRMMPWSA